MLDKPINFTNQTIHKRGLLDIVGGKLERHFLACQLWKIFMNCMKEYLHYKQK